jgi:hypothetical protein
VDLRIVEVTTEQRHCRGITVIPDPSGMNLVVAVDGHDLVISHPSVVPVVTEPPRARESPRSEQSSADPLAAQGDVPNLPRSAPLRDTS